MTNLGRTVVDRGNLPTLIPEMYALAGCNHLCRKIRPSANSNAMLVTIASNVFG